MSAETTVQRRWQPLTGGTAIWVFMSIEVLTFGLFFLAHAWGWRAEPSVFAESQARLHPASAARGTVMLLVGSWFAYQGVLANAAGRPRATASWLVAGAGAGLLFSANKIVEYASPNLAGITLSTNAFWFSYLFLTGLHLLHVLLGVAILCWLALRARRGATGPTHALDIEAGAAYWHLVDLIWVLLFPILYLMHP